MSGPSVLWPYTRVQWSPYIRMALIGAAIVAVAAGGRCPAAPKTWPIVSEVEKQPLVAATRRLVEALEYIGAPLNDGQRQRLEAAYEIEDPVRCARAIQEVLDPLCLVAVSINPESRVSVLEGPVKKELDEQGWRAFLLKVVNEAGITPELVVSSPNAAPVYQRGRGARQRPRSEQRLVDPKDIPDRFLDLEVYKRQPLKPRLSGLELEYRILQIYCRDAGKREAKLVFHVGQGTQDLGFRNELPILFQARPSTPVTFRVRDVDGKPTVASFVIRDSVGRVYPHPGRRLAPDFFFHQQIYRADGEGVRLPPGRYSIRVTRGPEYVPIERSVVVADRPMELTFQLKRWIHPAARGWYSGDHHVHAAGCSHYDSPTEGVSPADMMRHILGEDLNVGCVLSWGPCWYYQKQFFEGKTSDLSQPDYLMRYDVEVSGFPSSHAGHLCLLNLKEDDYPGTTVIEEWPSWTLPILQWAKQQGAVVGYSHSGWGLALPDYLPDGRRAFVNYRNIPEGWQGRAADRLPDFAMPRFDGIGANEYIVTVTHGAVDFISAVDTPAIWELNIWYHTLNCGFRTRISGETDFPCIYGDRVGLGRVYVKIPPGQPLTYENWIAGVRDGRSYCSDGFAHILDFRVNDLEVGVPGSGGEPGELRLNGPSTVTVRCDVAALLAESPTPETEAIRRRRPDQKPYWHIERCRIGQTRRVPLELIVNGLPVARREVLADGNTRPVTFTTRIERSSWIALRILPAAHTNPIFVVVDGRPIRASRRSAEWCRRAVDVCWESKHRNIGKDALHRGEREQAAQAYEFARKVYDRIIAESPQD